MVGKILLILLGVVLLACAVLLLLPVTVRVSYEQGELRAWLRFASWKIDLYPSQDKQEESRETAEAREKEPKQKKEPKRKKENVKPNWEQISYTLEALPRVLLRALQRTGRRITVTPLKLHLLVAGNDPADTAVLYGWLQGFLAAILPPLHQAVRIREQDIQLFPDFCEEKMDLIADVGVRIRPWDILVVAVFAAGGVIKWYIGYKKRADKPDTAQKNEKATAEAGTAA